jgi:hypothetical protein
MLMTAAVMPSHKYTLTTNNPPTTNDALPNDFLTTTDALRPLNIDIPFSRAEALNDHASKTHAVFHGHQKLRRIAGFGLQRVTLQVTFSMIIAVFWPSGRGKRSCVWVADMEDT